MCASPERRSNMMPCLTFDDWYKEVRRRDGGGVMVAQKKSMPNPRNLIICVTLCTVGAVWAVLSVAAYFYFFPPDPPEVHNVTEVRTVAPYRWELLPWYLNGSLTPTNTPDGEDIQVWHNQMPQDPLLRIENQLNLHPRGIGDTKVVLFWSDWSHSEVEEYQTTMCPVNSCVFTDARRILEEANAVVFRRPNLLGDFPQEYRPRSQIWIFNPLTTPGVDQFAHPKNVFNWTATPRLDSDVPMFPHGLWMYYNPTWRHQDPPLNVVGQKNLAAAAWFPSSCNEDSRAYRYIHRLKYHTLVDGHGVDSPCGDPCPQGNREICLKLLRTRYRVTLVMDSHMCNHSIPDMFYVALQSNTVPVVMVPPRSVYEQVAPEGSFIHVDDFPSHAALAQHLQTIYNDDAVFNKYLSWQGTGAFVKSWYCRLCALLHYDGLPERTIDDINEWWLPEGECRT